MHIFIYHIQNTCKGAHNVPPHCIDGQTDGQTDGWTDGQTDGPTHSFL